MKRRPQRFSHILQCECVAHSKRGVQRGASWSQHDLMLLLTHQTIRAALIRDKRGEPPPVTIDEHDAKLDPTEPAFADVEVVYQKDCAGACDNAGGDSNVGRGVAFAPRDRVRRDHERAYQNEPCLLYDGKCYAPTAFSMQDDQGM